MSSSLLSDEGKSRPSHLLTDDDSSSSSSSSSFDDHAGGAEDGASRTVLPPTSDEATKLIGGMIRRPALMDFLRGQIRSLMIDVFNVSPFVADELEKILRLIGTDSDVTVIYDTLTCANQWRLAISLYDEPVTEHAMFGMMTYTMHCPLDKMVYCMLVGQSLAVCYDTYKNWATVARLRAATKYVVCAETLRRCATLRDTVADETRSFLHETFRYLGDNVVSIAMECIDSLLRELDVNALGETLRRDMVIVAKSLEKMLATLSETRRRAIDRVVASTTATTAAATTSTRRVTKDRRSERVRSRAGVDRKK